MKRYVEQKNPDKIKKKIFKSSASPQTHYMSEGTCWTTRKSWQHTKHQHHTKHTTDSEETCWTTRKSWQHTEYHQQHTWHASSSRELCWITGISDNIQNIIDITSCTLNPVKRLVEQEKSWQCTHHHTWNISFNGQICWISGKSWQHPKHQQHHTWINTSSGQTCWNERRDNIQNIINIILGSTHPVDRLVEMKDNIQNIINITPRTPHPVQSHPDSIQHNTPRTPHPVQSHSDSKKKKASASSVPQQTTPNRKAHTDLQMCLCWKHKTQSTTQY